VQRADPETVWHAARKGEGRSYIETGTTAINGHQTSVTSTRAYYRSKARRRVEREPRSDPPLQGLAGGSGQSRPRTRSEAMKCEDREDAPRPSPMPRPPLPRWSEVDMHVYRGLKEKQYYERDHPVQGVNEAIAEDATRDPNGVPAGRRCRRGLGTPFKCCPVWSEEFGTHALIDTPPNFRTGLHGSGGRASHDRRASQSSI